MAKAKSPLLGRWHIVSMADYGDEYLDEEVEAFIEINDQGWGSFHFGNVQGQMDCRVTTRDGEPAVEWSWDGNAEMDAAQGRGWAAVKGEELHGMIFLHGGDDFEFVARRVKGRRRRERGAANDQRSQ